MEIILRQNIEKLGRKGEVKTVKPGFYTNFLCPRGLAFKVTPKRLAWAEGLQEKMVKEKVQIAKEADKYKAELAKITLVIEAKTTDKDTLYGKIAEKELAAALENQAKVKLDKKQIKLDKPIKEVGKHKFTVHLADNVDVEVALEIKAKA